MNGKFVRSRATEVVRTTTTSANAWTDSAGHLHLRLAMRDNHWTSAEVILSRALGYGTYVLPFEIRRSIRPPHLAC